MTREVVCHGVEAPDLGLIAVKRYIEGDTLDIEWEHIWCTQWLLAGLVSDVREPGEFFVFEIGTEQILIARTAKGDLKAFYNVCQHRGNRLVNERSGRAEDFRCLYHAWTYDLDGQLKGVPGLANFLVYSFQLSFTDIKTIFLLEDRSNTKIFFLTSIVLIKSLI